MRRERDSGDQARRFLALVWSLIGGALGAALGLLLASSRGWPTLPSLTGFFLLGAGLVYFFVEGIAQWAGDAVASLLTPSGQSTPARPEYSLAESLVVRGRYEEAVATYERHSVDSPLAPDPHLHLARLYRDRLKDAERAVSHFRRARDLATDPAFEHLITRELVEVLVNRMGDAARAMPDLARLVERHGDSPGGVWARAELRQLKSKLDPPGPTGIIREGEK